MQIAWRSLRILPFMYDTEYGPETENGMADCLSHLPLSLPDAQINDDIAYLHKRTYYSTGELFRTTV